MRKWQVFGSTLIACLLLSEVQLSFPKIQGGDWLQIHSEALARSSGGRSRSGSFNRGSSPSRSSKPSGNSQRNNRQNSPPSSSGSNSRPNSPSQSTSPAENSQRNNRQNSPPSSSGSNSRPSSSGGGAQGTTGGRTRTGTFERNSPAPTPTQPRPSASPQPVPVPASPRVNNNPPPTYNPQPPVNRRDTVIVPVPVPVQPRYYPPVQPNYPGQNYPVQTQTAPVPVTTTQPGSTTVAGNRNSGSHFWVWFLILGGIVAAIAIAWYFLSRKQDGAPTAEEELSNDIVTVTQLQVALLAEARHIQSELRDLSMNADLESAPGRSEFLRECALALLRSPEYWSHVVATSKTVENLQQAQTLFEKLSITERSKFSQETFTRDQGSIRRRQDIITDPNEEPPAYIVVTFLVGTENDQPLFGAIHSAEELEQSLKTLASLPPEYLLVFELLWSPEVESDSLTYDELLSEYSNMIQI